MLSGTIERADERLFERSCERSCERLCERIYERSRERLCIDKKVTCIYGLCERLCEL